MARKKVYRVHFSAHGKSYEIYARSVVQSEIYGFIDVEGLLFGERTAVLVDPAEEMLKAEFSGVRKITLPYHAVFRIDEVEREGRGKVLELASAADKAAPSLPIPGKGPFR